MAAEPLVSVVMPAYNSEPFIGAAIESVLAQTYPHFELLVIDDSSTDGTAAIALSYERRDPRLRVHSQPHSGIAASRNVGLFLAQGEYLAWLDADDLAHPHRLELEAAALQSNPAWVIVGSAYQAIDACGNPQAIHRMPETDTHLRWHSLFHSPFAQSSVMLRMGILRSTKTTYDLSMPPVEDYELWSRLLQYGQGHNLSEPLVSYRLHPAQASQQDQSRLWSLASTVAQKNLRSVGVALSFEQVQLLRKWYYQFPGRFSAANLPLAETFLDVLNRFSLQPGLDGVEVKRLRGRWLGRLLRAGLRSGNPGWFLWLVRQLTLDDIRLILAYFRVRETL